MHKNERVDVTECDPCRCPIIMDGRELCGGVTVRGKPVEIRQRFGRYVMAEPGVMSNDED